MQAYRKCTVRTVQKPVVKDTIIGLVYRTGTVRTAVGASKRASVTEKKAAKFNWKRTEEDDDGDPRTQEQAYLS
jgi:hypothetical protein